MSDIVIVKAYRTTAAQRKATAKWNGAHREEHLQMKRNWIKQNQDKNRAAVAKFRAKAKCEKGFKELAAISCF